MIMHDDDRTAAWRRVAAAGDELSLAVACQACATDLDADCLGVSLIVAGEVRLLGCATDERAERMEDAQLVAGEGPCTDAYRYRGLVEEADLYRAFDRWPAFTQAAAEQNIRSVMAFPLVLGTLAIGVADVYRTEPGLLTARERNRARAYARILAVLALDEHPHLATSAPRSPRPGPQGYPPSIHMAAGVLAEVDNLVPEDALARLRAHAFAHNVPLVQTADHVLTHRTLD
ncbi:hypothetical protein DI272_24120 [Streptomyces sp. Act143]|uniref:GAF and ANTAR domain-containing protein n=1 Tax=Streptomyces sp. Act143 TaxID=2200760 RepID=UPI000D6734B0|nr:GAF and ANTAR domain-containing protein [Streptomyces sp. Act143]PWI16906.1 hypothetical protein DI272_24120 [Streptomyces sp. Act143]